MTDARSTYDESNEVWPYFILTILGVILVPMTIEQLFQLLASPSKGKPISPTHSEFRASLSRKRLLSSGKLWSVVAGWAMVASLITFINRTGNSTVVSTPEIWDPYQILSVAKSASVKEIRSAYRKLSLEFHPDKVKDLAESTKDEIEAAYVDISKAYRALTDETTRENYILYGHPDGPQPVTHGIALPAFLFNPAASVSFVATYLLGFGIGIPLIVGRWWQSSQKRTRKGLLQDTATQFSEMLAKEQAHFITGKRILKTILMSPDMDETLKGLGEAAASLDFAGRSKVLESYLNRNTPQKHIELVVATETARLLLGLHDIAAVFRSFLLCQRSLELRRAIIQGVPFDQVNNGEYLQLKGASLELATKGDNKDRESILKTVDSARSYFPRLHLLDANFRVVGESKVTTASQVHLEIKFLVLPLGDTAPELSKKDIHPDEESVGLDAGFRDPASVNTRQPELPDAVAPFYPVDLQTSWYIYLYAERDNKLMEKPLEITNLDLHNLSLSREQVKKGDDIVVGTLVLPISSSTPPQPDQIPLRVALTSSTYFGADIRTPVVMDVVQASEPIKQDGPLPEEEEDEEEDDQESDEEVEGLSDIDTSTEEEDNADDD